MDKILKPTKNHPVVNKLPFGRFFALTEVIFGSRLGWRE